MAYKRVVYNYKPTLWGVAACLPGAVSLFLLTIQSKKGVNILFFTKKGLTILVFCGKLFLGWLGFAL